jgi:AcrR family transcriptional regulator
MSLREVTRRSATKSAALSTEGRYEAGKQRVADIMAAAKATLVKGGYAQLTLRRVASEAGIPLRHLQYYYPTKAELLRAVCESICNDYIAKCDLMAAQAHADPKSQFIACVDYLIEDNRDPKSNAIMFELSALRCHDKNARRDLARLFDYYRAYIGELIRKMRPSASAELIEMRALQVIALIEGLAQFIDHNMPRIAAARDIAADARKNILRIALSK